MLHLRRSCPSLPASFVVMEDNAALEALLNETALPTTEYVKVPINDPQGHAEYLWAQVILPPVLNKIEVRESERRRVRFYVCCMLKCIHLTFSLQSFKKCASFWAICAFDLPGITFVGIRFNTRQYL